MRTRERILAGSAFVAVIGLIVVLWFFTTGAALKQAASRAFADEQEAWSEVADEFSVVHDRARAALDSLSQQQQYVAAAASSTPAIDPAIISIISQQLSAQSTTTPYAEDN